MKENSPIEDALKILARKRASSEEIRKRLTEKGFNREEIEKTITYLNDSRYLNDEEMLIDYIKLLMEKRLYGSERVVTLLSRRGFAPERIREKISEIYTEEVLVKMAHQFLKKKFAIVDRSDKRLKEKVIRSLLYRGFNWEIIERILNK